MIKINLLGKAKVKAARTKTVRTASNQTLMVIMAASVVLISIGIIYFWERILSQKDAELSSQIAQARKEKIRQESLLKENEIFEKRRKLLEMRIGVIESLKHNQSGPVQVLDVLSDCVQKDGWSLAARVRPERQSHHSERPGDRFTERDRRLPHQLRASGKIQERYFGEHSGS